MKWIDSGDLKNWVNGKQRHCQQTLPELIRRLIFATSSSIEQIHFPSGDSIATSGWDGSLKTSTISPFFPTGQSRWEIGVEDSAKSKADSDYVKRTADPLDVKLDETTFVFVTPRSWPGRVKWSEEKKKDNKWKDVRVVNIDSLEQWLESAPAVALWLAKQLGKAVSHNIRGLENFWEEWSLSTDPKMTADLVIGGRISNVEKIQKWINDKASILEVQGDAPDEAFAFLYGSIDLLPDQEKTKALSRCVVVDNLTDFRACIDAFQNPLIIAAPGSCIEAAGLAVAKGHHVFLTMDSKVIDMGRIMKLARTQREAVEKALKKNGMSDSDAQRISRDSGRSIPVLRRHLFRSKAVSAPSWATVDNASILFPVLFAGSWNERQEDDKKIIEVLSGDDYASFSKKLTGLLSIDDSPLRKVGDVWMIKSPLDVWFLIGRHLNDDQLKRYEQAISAVLTKTNPKYELPADQRWAAGMYGKSNPYSEWLRTGLVESLALLSVYDDRSSTTTSISFFADRIVRNIFEQATTWEVWASLSDVSPLLSEASPVGFLESLEKTLKDKPEVFVDLMSDEDSLWGECKHSGLLWALEGLSWSVDYFTKTTDILMNLAKIDKGGRWSNRPGNSLKDIFVPGLPQTHVKPEDRVTVFKTLSEKDSVLMWKIALGYFDMGSISPSHHFRWRETGGTRTGLEQESNKEYNDYLRGVFPVFIKLACSIENRISSMGHFIRLSPEMREKLIEALENGEPSDYSKEDIENLLKETREALNWINSFDSEKKFQIYRKGLANIIEKYTPQDAIQKNGWLLNNPWPRLPDGDQKDYRNNETQIKEAREKAAREVLDKSSFESIFEFAKTNQYVLLFGHAIGNVIKDQAEDKKILDAFIGQLPSNSGLIIGYTMGRIEMEGKGWVKSQITRLRSDNLYTDEIASLLYLGMPVGLETWTDLFQEEKAVNTEYWKKVRIFSLNGKNEEAAIAVEQLLNAKRPAAALQVAGDPKISLSSTLLKRLLQDLVFSENEEEKKVGDVMDEYHLGHVFNQIYERNELTVEEVARLEWPFGPLLKDISRYTSSRPAIYRSLEKDPSFFVQLITFMFKNDDHTPDENQKDLSQKQKETIAKNAWEVLHRWQTLPGSKDDGSIDENLLTQWIESVRNLCKENGYTRGGDMKIAELLSHAPSDMDGTWPHVAVRNLIEKLNNPLIDKHIRFGVFNNRGVVARGIGDGGNQERALSKHYKDMSEKVKIKWPRTAMILKELADWYDNNAKQEDIDSDLHDLRFD